LVSRTMASRRPVDDRSKATHGRFSSKSGTGVPRSAPGRCAPPRHHPPIGRQIQDLAAVTAPPRLAPAFGRARGPAPGRRKRRDIDLGSPEALDWNEMNRPSGEKRATSSSNCEARRGPPWPEPSSGIARYRIRPTARCVNSRCAHPARHPVIPGASRRRHHRLLLGRSPGSSEKSAVAADRAVKRTATVRPAMNGPGFSELWRDVNRVRSDARGRWSTSPSHIAHHVDHGAEREDVLRASARPAPRAVPAPMYSPFPVTPTGHHHVRRLQVAVHDALAMRLVRASATRSRKRRVSANGSGPRPSGRRASPRRAAPDQKLQGLGSGAWDWGSALADVVDAADVWMRELRDRPRLAVNASRASATWRCRASHLTRVAIEARVARLVDLAHRPGADGATISYGPSRSGRRLTRGELTIGEL
jgi:hypothetical protein